MRFQRRFNFFLGAQPLCFGVVKKQPHLEGGNAERHASVLSLGCPLKYLADLLWYGDVLVKRYLSDAGFWYRCSEEPVLPYSG